MKKTLIILTIVTLILVAAFSFSGCSLIAKAQGKTYISYVQSGAYSSGNAEEDIIPEDILINWYGGSVNITQYDGDKIVFFEKANKELTDALKLHWAFWDSSEYGKYYSIKYCAKGMYDLSEIKKDLYVLLPKDTLSYNQISVTARGECSINIDLPDVSVIGECQGNPNVHLDAEWGNIDAAFKDVDSFRMIGDADEVANQYFRRLTAQKVGTIDCVASFNKFIFNVDEIKSSAEIKTFSGDVFFSCYGNVRSLNIDGGLGTKYVFAHSFNKLNFKSKTGIIGVAMNYKQAFQVTMSNYNEYGANLAYKDPTFVGKIAYVLEEDLQPGDPDDKLDLVHEGDTWIVRGGKDKVNVSSGADVYFGNNSQALYDIFVETGVFDNIYDTPNVEIPDEYKTQDSQQNGNNNQDPQYDPNNPNGDPNYNQDPNGNGQDPNNNNQN